MKITFLGTKGEIEESSQNHSKESAVLLEADGKRILLDCGRQLAEKIDDLKLDAIVLSHAHPDHAFGLQGKTLDIPVYLNKITSKLLPEDSFPMKDRKLFNRSFSFDGIDFKVIPVVHSIKAPAVGFIISTEGVKVGYFPDVLWIPDREKAWKNLDFLITDGSSVTKDLTRKRGDKLFGHASIKTILGWAKKDNVKNVILTHFGKEAVEMGDEKLELKVKEFAA